ncbi:hypothetical protein IVB08_00315 [Bradyrhizobium sp. 173]|uniref:hypothetical protein n=1 Tax=Bradyrhizobium sp. 173 TaxID=2782644 RepID=UPI001FF96884|nr:hypothetical protein [Bradyrhizobium sp. 173]MCK1562454.1 hypothetical protein [Bradyrhizobium sp. 173]
MWKYRCYDDGGQPNLWRRWYESNADVQGSHDSVFDGLETMVSWREPWTKFIDKGERIIEVRLSGKLEWRVFGFHSGAQREFVVLGAGSKKGKVYTPADIKKTVIKRKKEVEADLGKAPSCGRPK